LGIFPEKLGDLFLRIYRVCDKHIRKVDPWIIGNLMLSMLASGAPVYLTYREDLNIIEVEHHTRRGVGKFYLLGQPIEYNGGAFRGFRYVVVDLENGSYRTVSDEEAEKYEYLDVLDWVGQKYYPSFIHFFAEALDMGISRRAGKWLHKFVPGLSKVFLIVEGKICAFFVPHYVIYTLDVEKCKEEVKEFVKKKIKDEKLREIAMKHIICEHLSEALGEESARGCGTIRPGKYLRSKR